MSIIDRFIGRKKQDPEPTPIPNTTDSVPQLKYSMPWLLGMASRYKLQVSSDSGRVLEILGALNVTNGYCPCVPKYARNDDTVCPCTQMRNEGICHCRLFQNKVAVHDDGKSSVVSIRANNNTAKVDRQYMAVTAVSSTAGDPQTLVIQYDNPGDLAVIRGIVRSYKNKSATAFIDAFREIDIFVNLNDNPVVMRGKRWVRVIYECLKNNPDPSPTNGRFPNSYIVHVERTLDKPSTTLDMLLEGR